MSVLDASALLCFLQAEPGSDLVERELELGAVCSAANWSETAQKVLSRASDWRLARSLLLSYGVRVEPVLLEDAEAAAAMWKRGSGMSLAGRLCLATAERLGVVAWTADASWGTSDLVRQVR